MKKILLFWCIVFYACVVQAQSHPAQKWGHVLAVEAQSLFSTHGDIFKGASVLYAKSLSRFTLGLGAEYTYTPYHLDNGWQLYHLHFLPLFIDAKYLYVQKKKLDAYVQLAPGLTFANYKKADGVTPGIYQVREKGFYLYAGTGMHFKITNQWAALAA